MTSAQDSNRCSVCADSAARAEILEIAGKDAQIVLDSGTETMVAVDLIPDVHVGDIVLVHQGVAISKIKHEEISS